MPDTITRNFHLPLPETVYRRLREEADRLRVPATALAREAVEARLEELLRVKLHSELAHYAKQHAGTDADLDEQLEAAGVETLKRFGKTHRSSQRKGRKL